MKKPYADFKFTNELMAGIFLSPCSIVVRFVTAIVAVFASSCDRDPTVLYLDLNFDNGWRARGGWSDSERSVIYSNFEWSEGIQRIHKNAIDEFLVWYDGSSFDVGKFDPVNLDRLGMEDIGSDGLDTTVFNRRFDNGYLTLFYNDETGELFRIGILFNRQEIEYPGPNLFAIQFRIDSKIESGRSEKDAANAIGVNYKKERRRGLEF